MPTAYLQEMSSKQPHQIDKKDENELNLIEKYACAAYGLHNRFGTSDGNRLRFLLFTKSRDNKLRKLSPTKEALELHILHSVRAAGRIWGVPYLLYLKKLPWKSFRIMVASINGKHCPQPRAPGVCDFKELPK